MIMTYNGSSKPEAPPSTNDSKLGESENGNSSFQNFYQQQYNHQSQERFYNQRAPNQDLINVENSLQIQEQERRNKRQQ